MIYAALFFIITLVCFILAMKRGPIWGLIAYINIYFNNPDTRVNWWGEYLPDFRWSLFSVIILIISVIIHRDKLSKNKLGFIFFCMVVLFLIAVILTYTIAVAPSEAKTFTYMMMGYCIITFLIIKVLANSEQLRAFVLAIIMLGAFLGLQGYREGKMMDGRLNNIGPMDANGANELGILLAAIMPFLVPYIAHGKRHERIICFLSVPFIINGFTLTVSRGAFVALTLSVFYAFLFVADNQIKKNIIITLIFALPAFAYVTDSAYITRISTLWSADRNTEDEKDKLSSGRTAIWAYSWDMVSDYPLGTGPGGFKQIAQFYMPEEILTYRAGREYGVRAAHNTYLLILVEYGYLGIFVFIMICLAVLYSLYKSTRKVRQIGMRGSFLDLLIIAMNISVVCSLLGGMTGETFYYEFFWYQVAMTICLKSIVNNMEKIFHEEPTELHPAGMVDS